MATRARRSPGSYGGKDRASDFERARTLVADVLGRAGSLRHPVAILADPGAALALARVVARLPTLELWLGDGACCVGLRQELERTTLGVRTELLAPGVLLLPRTLEKALSGRSRQAVRTGLHQARRAGITLTPVEVPDRLALLAQLSGRTETPIVIAQWCRDLAPEMRWLAARNAAGVTLALSVVGACRHGARLARLVAVSPTEADGVSAARYLAHTGAVREAISHGSPVLIVDTPLGLTPGLLHFQRILGYSPTRIRLRVRGSRGLPSRLSRVRAFTCLPSRMRRAG